MAEPHAAQPLLWWLSVLIYSPRNFDGWAKIMTNWLVTSSPVPWPHHQQAGRFSTFRHAQPIIKPPRPMPSYQAPWYDSGGSNSLCCLFFFYLSTFCVAHSLWLTKYVSTTHCFSYKGLKRFNSIKKVLNEEDRIFFLWKTTMINAYSKYRGHFSPFCYIILYLLKAELWIRWKR